MDIEKKFTPLEIAPALARPRGLWGGLFLTGLTPRFIKYSLLAIVILAFVLRFWGVWDKDMIGDEAAYSFRSAGYLDYLGTSSQTQPVEWYKGTELPFWTKLSFHDHPPLTFVVQNVFFRIFGDSLWSARLPSAIFGSLSAILIYLIANILFGSAFLGLLAALLFGLNNGLIAISRTALMEPVLLFFVLANIYSFFRAKENKNWWWIFGVTLGLAFLAKYTAIFLIPLYFVYFILFERKSFKAGGLYLSLFLTASIFSPVLIYNYFLFRATGHFDLQFSYFLGQATPEWSGLLGKTQDGFGDIIKNLLGTFGLVDLLLFSGGFIYSLFAFKKEKSRGLAFTFLYLIVLTLFLAKIGSAARFLALYGPVFAVLSALFIRFLWQFSGEKAGIWFKTIAVILVVSALCFSIRENLLRRDVNNFGIAGLDNFLGQEIDGINSAFVPQTDNRHLNEIIGEAAADKTDGIQRPVLIVYNDNVAITTLQWIVYRRFFYHALPFYYVENFIGAVNKDPQGLRGTLVYFIQNTQNTLLNPFKKDKTAGDIFEKDLVRQGIAPVKIIYGNNSLEMFRVYKFSL
jgi:4-amino-4-deoxy-L-arabinose transferase-like glycosyltransferase